MPGNLKTSPIQRIRRINAAVPDEDMTVLLDFLDDEVLPLLVDVARKGHDVGRAKRARELIINIRGVDTGLTPLPTVDG